MKDIHDKNNPPVWFIILGIILVSAAAIFIMLAPAKPYTQKNQYYLNDAQGQVIYKHKPAEKLNSTFWMYKDLSA